MRKLDLGGGAARCEFPLQDKQPRCDRRPVWTDGYQTVRITGCKGVGHKYHVWSNIASISDRRVIQMKQSRRHSSSFNLSYTSWKCFECDGGFSVFYLFPVTYCSLLKQRLVHVRTKRRRRWRSSLSCFFGIRYTLIVIIVVVMAMALCPQIPVWRRLRRQQRRLSCHVVMSAAESISDRHHDIINSAGCPTKRPQKWVYSFVRTKMQGLGIWNMLARDTVYRCNYNDRHGVCNSPF